MIFGYFQLPFKVLIFKYLKNVDFGPKKIYVKFIQCLLGFPADLTQIYENHNL